MCINITYVIIVGRSRCVKKIVRLGKRRGFLAVYECFGVVYSFKFIEFEFCVKGEVCWYQFLTLDRKIFVTI
jgi:hypothetical protein